MPSISGACIDCLASNATDSFQMLNCGSYLNSLHLDNIDMVSHLWTHRKNGRQCSPTGRMAETIWSSSDHLDR